MTQHKWNKMYLLSACLPAESVCIYYSMAWIVESLRHDYTHTHTHMSRSGLKMFNNNEHPHPHPHACTPRNKTRKTKHQVWKFDVKSFPVNTSEMKKAKKRNTHFPDLCARLICEHMLFFCSTFLVARRVSNNQFHNACAMELFSMKTLKKTKLNILFTALKKFTRSE